MPWPSTIPLPRIQGYSYTLPVLLHRTEFADGSRWQRSSPGALRRQFTVYYDLDLDELRLLMNFLHDEGFGETLLGVPDHWISVPLVSGMNTDGSPTDHPVRVIADPKIQRLDGGDYYLVELQFEDQGPPAYIDWP